MIFSSLGERHLLLTVSIDILIDYILDILTIFL